jgi:hypothetical protein
MKPKQNIVSNPGDVNLVCLHWSKPGQPESARSQTFDKVLPSVTRVIRITSC